MSMPGFTAERLLYKTSGYDQRVAGSVDAIDRDARITPAFRTGCWNTIEWVDTPWGSFPSCLRHCVIALGPTPGHASHFIHTVSLC